MVIANSRSQPVFKFNFFPFSSFSRALNTKEREFKELIHLFLFLALFHALTPPNKPDYIQSGHPRHWQPQPQLPQPYPSGQLCRLANAAHPAAIALLTSARLRRSRPYIAVFGVISSSPFFQTVPGPREKEKNLFGRVKFNLTSKPLMMRRMRGLNPCARRYAIL